MQQVADVKPSRAVPVSDATFAEPLHPLIESGFRLALAMLHDQGRLRPWFLGVVANTCRNARRRKWMVEVSIGVPEDMPVASSEERTLRGADLRRAISRLGHDDRLVVALYFYLDMPLDEVAAVTGSSVGAARARLYRAIKKLRPDVAIEEA